MLRVSGCRCRLATAPTRGGRALGATGTGRGCGWTLCPALAVTALAPTLTARAILTARTLLALGPSRITPRTIALRGPRLRALTLGWVAWCTRTALAAVLAAGAITRPTLALRAGPILARAGAGPLALVIAARLAILARFSVLLRWGGRDGGRRVISRIQCCLLGGFRQDKLGKQPQQPQNDRRHHKP